MMSDESDKNVTYLLKCNYDDDDDDDDDNNDNNNNHRTLEPL